MATFHLSVTPIKRVNGRSATAAAAYRTATEIVDARTGEVHNYTRKRGVVSAHLVLPPHAPTWATDRSALWSAAELAETRTNSRVAREVRIGLPDALAPEARTQLANQYGAALAARYGVAVDVAVHLPDAKGDQRNHHAHLLMTTRELGPDGLQAKVRVLDDRTSGPGEVEWMRETWASMANAALERAQIAERVDHRSYARQGIDRLPTRHLGPKHTAFERKGGSTRIGRYNRRIGQRNQAAINPPPKAPVFAKPFIPSRDTFGTRSLADLAAQAQPSQSPASPCHDIQNLTRGELARLYNDLVAKEEQIRAEAAGIPLAQFEQLSYADQAKLSDGVGLSAEETRLINSIETRLEKLLPPSAAQPNPSGPSPADLAAQAVEATRKEKEQAQEAAAAAAALAARKGRGI